MVPVVLAPSGEGDDVVRRKYPQISSIGHFRHRLLADLWRKSIKAIGRRLQRLYEAGLGRGDDKVTPEVRHQEGSGDTDEERKILTNKYYPTMSMAERELLRYCHFYKGEAMLPLSFDRTNEGKL